MLAQALPPLWLMALSAYLLVSVPLAFSAALMVLAATFSSMRSRPLTRWAGALTLLVSVGNGIAVAYLRSIDQKPVPPNAEDRMWAAMMMVTIVLSALAWWRAARGRSPSSAS